jgi:hypothetical protein
MTTRVPPSLWQRLRGVAIFVAIVWAIAASFIAFDLLAVAVGGWVGAFDVGLPAAVQRSTVCNVADETKTGSPDTQAAAWLLGVQAGYLARTAATSEDLQGDTLRTATRQIAADARSAAEQLSARLQVPVPETYVPKNIVNAIVEFGQFVETSPYPTPEALAAAYGRRTCEIYKLGAYSGYSLLVRLPGTDNPYEVQVRYYARRLNIPDSLWQPIVAPVDDTVSNRVTAQISELARYFNSR